MSIDRSSFYFSCLKSEKTEQAAAPGAEFDAQQNPLDANYDDGPSMMPAASNFAGNQENWGASGDNWTATGAADGAEVFEWNQTSTTNTWAGNRAYP